MDTFSTKESFIYGWNKTKENFWFVVGVTLLALFIHIVLQTVADFFQDVPVLPVITHIILNVVGVILSIGLTKIFLRLFKNNSVEVFDLFDYYGLFWKYVFASILSSIIILVGFVLLIVPGIVFATKYIFVQVLVVDKGMGAHEALRESARITYGHKWNIFWFMLAMIGVNIVGFLVFGVGLLFTIPLTIFTFLFVYHKLVEMGGLMVVNQANPVPASSSVPTSSPEVALIPEVK